jgi:hypothetical protein
MSKSPLRDALLPSILVSSAVFSFMTLPLVLLESKPLTVDLPFYQHQGIIRPILTGGDRSFAIRYIGFVILSSVGAGVATVELTRRLSVRREERLEQRATASALGSVDSIQAAEPMSSIEMQPHSELEVTDSDFMPQAEYFDDQTLAFPGAIAIEAFSSFALEGSLDAFEPIDLPPQALDELDASPISTTQPVLVLAPQEYQTCRIGVPHVDKRLFAILFEDEYYSLFRARKTPEKAQEVAEKLRQRGNRAVITQIDQEHAVWVWEPEAYPSLA